MTTLGSLLKAAPKPLDIGSLVASLNGHAATASLGTPQAVTAAMQAWTDQDDDAHEPCSLVACRNPLHPGPCKGWKHTLHAVSPGVYHQLEEERVRKANARRLDRIAALKAQNKPIPRRLLTEIKAKPAPAHGATPVPLGQVNQKADLAGGQAHHAGQAITNAAGIKPSVPLPLGPKQKKPTIAGRGPAFVITQPKVTDHYKLDKAAKITPQEWDSLPAADKTAIRNELTAIKARGFGPQQTRADALLAKLPAPTTVRQAAPAAPSAPHPGKVSLGQAVKTISSTPAPAHVPTPAAPGGTPKALSPDAQHARAVAGRALGGRPTAKTHIEAYGKLSKADFDSLDSPTQKIIRNDLANARAKFLDPKKQQVAADLLDRFGSRHPAPAPAKAAPSAPAAPVVKGYSDPMNEAVKAARTETDRDAMLKRVGQLGHSSIADLTPADRQTVLNRLDATAGSGVLPQATKDKAAAYKRIIEGGSPAQTSRTWDHAPSVAELYSQEQKDASAKAAARDALTVDAALKAASTPSGLTPGAQRSDRIKALTALSKAQFDALKPDDQRKITDALHELHTDQKDPSSGISIRDKTIEAAFEKLTGTHPAVHRMRQAEADFRAGKIDGDKLERQFRHARVQAPGPTPAGKELAKEAQRIAEDNPKLPAYVRASMIDNPYGGPSYHSIAQAQNRFNYDTAPRLSPSDLSDIFHASEADLANSHPVHREAVTALRQNLISTGLAPGSPWSDATKNHTVDNLLHISTVRPEIPPERLSEFRKLPAGQQVLVRKVLRDRIDGQTDNHAKTATFIALRELEGRDAYTGAKRDAILAAASHYPTDSTLDAYRKLDPQDYDTLPSYVRDAIQAHLSEAQKRAEIGGAVRTWTAQDNALKVFPGALAAHLDGLRTRYADRESRNASDIANYGTHVINPHDRVMTYQNVGAGRFKNMSATDQAKIDTDLVVIANQSALPLGIRYNALATKDIQLSQSSHLDTDQIIAVASANPAHPLGDAATRNAFTPLSKADYDKLDKVYRDAIDARIATMPGSDQQVLNAKFHPQTVAANPAGVTPTTVQANVPPHVQAALDTIYGTHPKSHTMAHQLATYGALRGHDFAQLNPQEQNHLLSDLSFIHTTAKGPSKDKAGKLIDRFTPPGTPAGQIPTPPVIPPANSVPGQVRYPTPLVGTLVQAKDKGVGGDGWTTTPGGRRVWGKYGAAGVLLMHQDPATGEKRYLMVQRGPAISDPGKWQFPGGAIDSKETFHQGGAREVIEELGFPADAMKNAQVHGEHTNAIPGSTWKYVSIAAQVDKMIKPDLSTHHARAETSDAKWMTEAEIRKLDTDGKLLAPLAGGKLEQNVLSLFPQHAAPATLGQIVRPGPVTKRLKRLTLPSGGRQTPANFNAWPHAHKQSKGKDLIPDKAAFDAMRQTIKNDRTLYDGKTADGRLAAIGAKQGFDDTPTVMDKAEIDRLLATGDYIEAWRGVTGAGGGWSSRSRGGSGGKTAKQINEEMRSGPAYYGKGIFGNGYYLATQRRVAQQYSDGSSGSIVRVLIPKTAVTQKYDEVSRKSHASGPRMSKARGAGYGETSTFYDPGRYAAAKGIDGIEIEAHHVSPSGGARHVAAHGKPAFNWLNRSVLIVQKEPG